MRSREGFFLFPVPMAEMIGTPADLAIPARRSFAVTVSTQSTI